MYHLFCGFKNAQKPPHVCVLHKRCPSKCCKICRKARVLESIFNKVKLATLLKKTLTQVFSCEFFEIIKGDFFIKHLRVSASECWRLEKSSWLLISSPVRFLILNDSILTDLFMRCKNFIYKLFTKERKISSEFSEIFALLSMFFMFDHCWKGCKSFINICYLHDFFSMFVSCHFGPGWSNGVHGSFYCFLIDILFVQFFLVIHRS